MLVQFSVENCLSFRDRTTLSMVASSDDSLPGNTIDVPGRPGLRLVKAACLYGPNAAGKSNLLKAIGLMRRVVTESATTFGPSSRLPMVPFKLDPKTETAPSHFEAVFPTGGEMYTYGFRADAERIHEEWLTLAGPRRDKTLFRRRPDGRVTFGDAWRAGTGPSRTALERMTRDNALLLSVAAQQNHGTAVAISEWFSESITPVSRDPESGWERELTHHLAATSQGFGEWLLGFLDVADLGIQGLLADEEHDSPEDPSLQESRTLATRLPDSTRRESELLVDATRLMMEALARDARARHRTAQVLRARSDGHPVHFDLASEESAGTLRLFCLAGRWAVVVGTGGVLVIDEFESRLHPHVSKALLGGFCRYDSGAQLILATHDTNLLDLGVLRRDQIWFVDKGPDGASELYSLWDYKARRDENVRKGYLGGRYGAVPLIKEMSLGEEQEAPEPTARVRS